MNHITLKNDRLEPVGYESLIMKNVTTMKNEALALPNESAAAVATIYYSAAIRAYSISIPLMIGLCWFGIGANLFVLALLVSRVRKWNFTLKLIASLAANDSLTLFQISFGLLVNSYLPFVIGVQLPPAFKCWMFVIEAIRLGGIESSVLHILGLTLNQCLSVSEPSAYNRVARNGRLHCLVIANLLFGPSLFYLAVFLYNYQFTTSTSFVKNETSDEQCLPMFLLGATFRSIIFAAVLIPLLIVAVAYVKIVVTLRQLRKRLDRFGSSSGRRLSASPKSDQCCYRRNCQMAKSIALIIGTFLLGWVPGALWLMLTPESGPFPITRLMETHPHIVYSVGITVNFLIIFKSVLNPLMYAYRVLAFAVGGEPQAPQGPPGPPPLPQRRILPSAPASNQNTIMGSSAKRRGGNFSHHYQSMIPFLTVATPSSGRAQKKSGLDSCCCFPPGSSIIMMSSGDRRRKKSSGDGIRRTVRIPVPNNKRNSAVVHSCSDCIEPPRRDSVMAVYVQPTTNGGDRCHVISSAAL